VIRGRHVAVRNRHAADLIGLLLGGILISGVVAIQQHPPAYRVPASVGEVPLAHSASANSTPRVAHVLPPLPVPGRLRLAAARGPSLPLSLTIPSQGVGGAVVPVGYDRRTGELGVPGDPLTLGWWDDSALPGSRSGTVVMAGHVDTQTGGKGVLFNLEQIAPGQRVEVLTSRGVVTYQVAARHTYVKSDLPADVFDQSGRARLVLITCGGPFDARTHHYAYNIVVYALPLSS
jgi:LPXTG-site transpeptidase (sortase) family protein